MGSMFNRIQQIYHSNPTKYKRCLRKMIKRVNIFFKDFVLIPLNFENSLHWSLCIIVRPLLYILHQYIRDEDKMKNSIVCKENQQRGCILHMNSYPGVHLQAQVFKEINEFLSELWMLQRHDGSVSATLNDYLRKYGLSVSENVDIVGLVNTQIDKCGITNIFESCPTVVCKVPVQPNGYDCGVYVLKFVDCLLSTELSTNEEEIESSLINQIHDQMFTHADLNEYRADLLSTLNILTAEFTIWKQNNPSNGHDDGGSVEIIEPEGGNAESRVTRNKGSQLKVGIVSKQTITYSLSL